MKSYFSAAALVFLLPITALGADFVSVSGNTSGNKIVLLISSGYVQSRSTAVFSTMVLEKTPSGLVVKEVDELSYEIFGSADSGKSVSLEKGRIRLNENKPVELKLSNDIVKRRVVQIEVWP
jgi:hypothetical protein